MIKYPSGVCSGYSQVAGNREGVNTTLKSVGGEIVELKLKKVFADKPLLQDVMQNL